MRMKNDIDKQYHYHNHNHNHNHNLVIASRFCSRFSILVPCHTALAFFLLVLVFLVSQVLLGCMLSLHRHSTWAPLLGKSQCFFFFSTERKIDTLAKNGVKLHANEMKRLCHTQSKCLLPHTPHQHTTNYTYIKKSFIYMCAFVCVCCGRESKRHFRVHHSRSAAFKPHCPSLSHTQ